MVHVYNGSAEGTLKHQLNLSLEAIYGWITSCKCWWSHITYVYGI